MIVVAALQQTPRMHSVPPCGSGSVRSFVLTIDLGFAPTRYREVVLPAFKFGRQLLY